MFAASSPAAKWSPIGSGVLTAARKVAQNRSGLRNEGIAGMDFLRLQYVSSRRRNLRRMRRVMEFPGHSVLLLATRGSQGQIQADLPAEMRSRRAYRPMARLRLPVSALLGLYPTT